MKLNIFNNLYNKVIGSKVRLNLFAQWVAFEFIITRFFTCNIGFEIQPSITHLQKPFVVQVLNVPVDTQFMHTIVSKGLNQSQTVEGQTEMSMHINLMQLDECS